MPSQCDCIDTALARRSAEGDLRALAELWTRHAALVRRVINRTLRRLGMERDTDDLVQDVAEKVRRKVYQFRGDAKFSTWLAQVANRMALTAGQSGYARIMRASRPLPGPTSDSERRGDSTECALPLLDWDLPTCDPPILRRLRELPDLYRVPIELRFLDGLTHAEIAIQLGEKKATIDTRVRRALERLRGSEDESNAVRMQSATDRGATTPSGP